MRRAVTLCLPLLVLACGARPPAQVWLPPDATTGAAEPTRSAILASSGSFATPAVLAGRPADAARAAAQVEYLATELSTGPRWVGMNPTVGLQMVAARQELRSTLAIPAEAPPQLVVDGLYGAARALGNGDATAAAAGLPPAAFPDPRTTMMRLAALPALPQTSIATARAAEAMYRADRDGLQQNQGGDGGGGGFN